MIPTYCERANIAEVVEGLARVQWPASVEFWVVDDASPDGTGDVVAALAPTVPEVRLLRRAGRKGRRGGAVLHAMRTWLDATAARSDVDALFLEMDGDGSHDPGAVPAMLRAATDADVVLGSRYTPGGLAVLSPLRRMLSVVANSFVRRVLGLPYADSTTGFRAYRRSALARVSLDALRTEGHATHIELLLRLHQTGASIAEAPIRYAARRGGDSKVTWLEVGRVLWALSRLRAGEVRRSFGESSAS